VVRHAVDLDHDPRPLEDHVAFIAADPPVCGQRRAPAGRRRRGARSRRAVDAAHAGRREVAARAQMLDPVTCDPVRAQLVGTDDPVLPPCLALPCHLRDDAACGPRPPTHIRICG